MSFSKEQVKALSAPLDASAVKTRKQAGRELSYIEGWKAIEEANRIFGFDAWTRELLRMEPVQSEKTKIGQAQREGWRVAYIATVRVRVGDVLREGTGYGQGIDVDLGSAHESAVKEAETDAMKRALMTFGYPFGLALYDKTRSHVTNGQDTNSAPPNRGQQMHGPLKITELKEKMRQLAADLGHIEAQGTTEDDLVALINSYQPIIEQCMRDLPSWWYGVEGSDNKGAMERIEQVRAKLKEKDMQAETIYG